MSKISKLLYYMLIPEFNFAHFFRNYSSDRFKILRCDRNNIFLHFFSTHLVLSKQ